MRLINSVSGAVQNCASGFRTGGDYLLPSKKKEFSLAFKAMLLTPLDMNVVAIA